MKSPPGICFVRNCPTASGTFYQLPTDDVCRKDVWLKRLKRGNADVEAALQGEGGAIANHVIICEKHFSEVQYVEYNGVRQLRYDALPDLYLTTPPPAATDNESIKEEVPETASQQTTLPKPSVTAKRPQQKLAIPAGVLPSVPYPEALVINHTVAAANNAAGIDSTQFVAQLSETNALLMPTVIPEKRVLIKGISPLLLSDTLPKIPTSAIAKPKVPLISRVPMKLKTPLNIPAQKRIVTDTLNIPSQRRVITTRSIPLNVPAQEINSDPEKKKASGSGDDQGTGQIKKRVAAATTIADSSGKKPRLLAPKPYVPVAVRCRLCAQSCKQHMVDIYGPEGEQWEIAKKISEVLHVPVSKTDQLPLRVCHPCCDHLKVCHRFITDFTKANEKLGQLLTNEQEMETSVKEQRPIPLILIDNNTQECNEESLVDGPTRLRVITEKFVHVDRKLAPPEQIAQVIETVKAGLGSDHEISLSSLCGPTSEQDLDRTGQKNSGKSYKCSLCNEILHDWFSLIQHQLQKFQCRTCKARFCNKKARLSHRRSSHHKDKTYHHNTCYKCHEQFSNRQELYEHKLEFHALTCDCCSRSFTSKLPLIGHIKKQLNAERFVCKDCGRKCEKRSIFLAHHTRCILNSKADRLISCKVCKKKIKSSKYKEHKKTHQPDYVPKKVFICSYCNKTFAKHCKLTRHVKFHQEKKLQCPQCPRKFVVSTELKYHLEVHANEHKYECDLCGTRLLHKVHLVKHMRNKHLQEKSYMCLVCNQRFVNKAVVEEHCEEHPIEEKINFLTPYKVITSFYCQQCDKFYCTKYSLDKHMQRHKDKELGRYLMCEFCGRSFSSKPRLNLHLKEHDETGELSRSAEKIEKKQKADEQKRYACQMCSKRYATTVQLLAHTACHTGVKPFKCNLCDATFTTKMNKNNHELRHKGIKDFMCQYCNKSFYGRYNLRMHIRTHTKEKPYQCTYCPKAFPRRSNFTTHLRVHTGDRPYECDICKHKFTQKSSRDKHLATHLQSKMYHCDSCEFSSNKRVELADHIEEKHNANVTSNQIYQSKDEEIQLQAVEAEYQIQIIEQEVISFA